MGALLSAVWAGLSRLFGSRLGQWVAGVLVFFGIQFATNELIIGPTLDWLKSQIQIAGDAAAWMGYFNIDRYITIIFSAFAAAASVGAAKNVVMRKASA